MNTGEMRHRITIEKQIKGKSSNGFKENTWETVSTTWASITTQKMTKTIENDQIVQDIATVFIIRYREMTKDMRITYQGRTYEIKTIEDKEFKKRYLTIGTKEVVS